MKQHPQNLISRVYLILLLLAGAAHYFEGSSIPCLNTLLFVINYTIYAGLILFWSMSVRSRLFPSRTRTELFLCAVFMIVFLILRAYRYRISSDNSPSYYYSWYAYYIPITIIPTLFFMSCIHFIRPGKPDSPVFSWLILLPAVILSVLAITNDFHHLLFRQISDSAVTEAWQKTYTASGVFYAIYIWAALCLLAGIASLLIYFRRHADALKKMGLSLLIAILVFLCLTILVSYAPIFGFRSPYAWPEIVIFTILSIIELCIRYKLIASNENYTGFFSVMSAPALVTDRQFTPVYHSAGPINASPEQMKDALKHPVSLDTNTQLVGISIPSGFSFITSDSSVPNEINEKMAEANEMLAEENDLIQAENKQETEKAAMDSRNKAYTKVFSALYPTQQKISALLEGTSPDSDNFRDTMALCCVLNAYVKRKSNLMLLEERDTAPDTRELLLALQESVRYLQFCGVSGAANATGESHFSLKNMIKLYDTFEVLLEALLPQIHRCITTITSTGLRIVLDAKEPLSLPATPLPVTQQVSDGLVYLSVRCEKGAAA